MAQASVVIGVDPRSELVDRQPADLRLEVGHTGHGAPDGTFNGFNRRTLHQVAVDAGAQNCQHRRSNGLTGEDHDARLGVGGLDAKCRVDPSTSRATVDQVTEAVVTASRHDAIEQHDVRMQVVDELHSTVGIWCRAYDLEAGE